MPLSRLCVRGGSDGKSQRQMSTGLQREEHFQVLQWGSHHFLAFAWLQSQGIVLVTTLARSRVGWI